MHDLVPKDFDVYVGTGYMFERDVIAVQLGAPDESRQVRHRFSSYVTVQWELDARSVLSTTMYVQPAFEDVTNVRLLDETLLSFKVTKLLVASVAGSVRYDSDPPTGVKTTDMEIKNTLSVTF